MYPWFCLINLFNFRNTISTNLDFYKRMIQNWSEKFEPKIANPRRDRRRNIYIHTLSFLSPNIAYAGNSLSIVLAPTVNIHGAVFDTDPGSGPELPAEHETVMPFRTAWNDPIASPSSKKLSGSLPRETEMTSTPSWMAASKAARMSESKHSLPLTGVQQT